MSKGLKIVLSSLLLLGAFFGPVFSRIALANPSYTVTDAEGNETTVHDPHRLVSFSFEVEHPEGEPPEGDTNVYPDVSTNYRVSFRLSNAGLASGGTVTLSFPSSFNLEFVQVTNISPGSFGDPVISANDIKLTAASEIGDGTTIRFTVEDISNSTPGTHTISLDATDFEGTSTTTTISGEPAPHNEGDCHHWYQIACWIVKLVVKPFLLVIAGLIGVIAKFILGLIANLTSLVLEATTQDMAGTADQITMAEAGFAITLSIANIGFVLAILVIAFATIFRRLDYSIQKALPRLIIVAVLINFSFFIVNQFIVVSNGITTSIFGLVKTEIKNGFVLNPNDIEAIGGNMVPVEPLEGCNPDDYPAGSDECQPCPGNPGSYCRYERAGIFTPVEPVEYCDPDDYPPGSNRCQPCPGNPGSYCRYAPPGSTAQQIAEAFILLILPIFYLIFSLIAAFGMIALAIMFLIRYVALIILLTLMPFVLVLWIFPNLKIGGAGGAWDKWTGELTKWLIFGPVSMLFVYIAFKISVANSQPLVAMIVKLGILVGGLMVAQKLGVTGAGWANKTAGVMTRRGAGFLASKGLGGLGKGAQLLGGGMRRAGEVPPKVTLQKPVEPLAGAKAVNPAVDAALAKRAAGLDRTKAEQRLLKAHERAQDVRFAGDQDVAAGAAADFLGRSLEEAKAGVRPPEAPKPAAGPRLAPLGNRIDPYTGEEIMPPVSTGAGVAGAAGGTIGGMSREMPPQPIPAPETEPTPEAPKPAGPKDMSFGEMGEELKSRAAGAGLVGMGKVQGAVEAIGGAGEAVGEALRNPGRTTLRGAGSAVKGLGRGLESLAKRADKWGKGGPTFKDLGKEGWKELKHLAGDPDKGVFAGLVGGKGHDAEIKELKEKSKELRRKKRDLEDIVDVEMAKPSNQRNTDLIAKTKREIRQHEDDIEDLKDKITDKKAEKNKPKEKKDDHAPKGGAEPKH